MDVLIATRNPGKLKTCRILLERAGLNGKSPGEAGVGLIEVIENGRTAEENALVKAQAYFRQTGMSVFATDSAMEIDSLGGLPGVMVRRWNGRLPDDISDEQWLEFFLEETSRIPEPERTGKFITAWAIIHQGHSYIHHVQRPFHFASQKLRPISPGFPMSAIISTTREDVVEQIYVPAFLQWVKWEKIFT